MASTALGMRGEGAVFDPAAFRISAYRRWLLGGVAGAVAVLLLGWFFLIRPELTESAQLRDRASASADEAAALQRRLNEVRAENTKLAEYRTAYAAARQALPTTAAATAFLRDVQAGATRAGTELRGLTIGTPALLPAGDVYAIPMTVTAAGSVSALDNFLHQLQRVQPRTVLVNELSMTSDGARPTLADDVALTIGLQAFVAPAASTATESTPN